MTTAEREIRSNRWNCGRASRLQIVSGIVFAGATLGFLFFPPATDGRSLFLRALPALFCLLWGAVFFRTMLRDVRASIDELQRRIHLEAALGACVAVYIAMFVYPVLENAKLVGPLDPGNVLVMLAVVYGSGYLAAQRRYR